MQVADQMHDEFQRNEPFLGIGARVGKLDIDNVFCWQAMIYANQNLLSEATLNTRNRGDIPNPACA